MWPSSGGGEQNSWRDGRDRGGLAVAGGCNLTGNNGLLHTSSSSLASVVPVGTLLCGLV